MDECGAARKGTKTTDGCVPYDYDAQGWPLGFRCSTLGCGAWLCSNTTHFLKVEIRGRIQSFCRVCVEKGAVKDKVIDKIF